LAGGARGPEEALPGLDQAGGGVEGAEGDAGQRLAAAVGEHAGDDAVVGDGERPQGAGGRPVLAGGGGRRRPAPLPKPPPTAAPREVARGGRGGGAARGGEGGRTGVGGGPAADGGQLPGVVEGEGDRRRVRAVEGGPVRALHRHVPDVGGGALREVDADALLR